MGRYADVIETMLRKPTMVALRQYLGIGSATVTEDDLSFSDVTTANSDASKHGLLPKLSGNAGEFLNGTGGWTTAAGAGTVTSVALTMPIGIFDIAGSPITGAGTLAVTFDSQSANLVFAGPASGGAAAPTMRSLVEADTTLSDVTTNNASSARHGYLPKLSNVATQFLDGVGTFDTVKDSDLSLSDITTNNVSTTAHGFAPKGENTGTKFLRDDATWAVPAGASSDWDTVITKSADQTVTNNSTLQDDSELVTALDANSLYLVQLILLQSANDTTGDYKGSFAIPTVTSGTSTGFFCGFTAGAVASLTVLSNGAVQFPSADQTMPGLAGDNPLTHTIQFVLKTEAAAGNLQWKFANNSAGVGRTSTTHKGSTLRVKKWEA